MKREKGVLHGFFPSPEPGSAHGRIGLDSIWLGKIQFSNIIFGSDQVFWILGKKNLAPSLAIHWSCIGFFGRSNQIHRIGRSIIVSTSWMVDGFWWDIIFQEVFFIRREGLRCRPHQPNMKD